MRTSKIQELGARALVWAPNATEQVSIPATLWGTADDIEIESRVLVDGQPAELCVTFTAEGGYAGGRVRISDLLAAIAQHHPQLVRTACTQPSAVEAGNNS